MLVTDDEGFDFFFEFWYCYTYGFTAAGGVEAVPRQHAHFFFLKKKMFPDFSESNPKWIWIKVPPINSDIAWLCGLMC